MGTSLAIQWLRFSFPAPGMWVQSLVRELRSHMPRGVAKNNIKENSIVVFKKK